MSAIPQIFDLARIRGSGGDGKGGGGSTPTNAPNTLRSRARARMIEAISEGPIEGLVNGEQSIFFDQTPVRNADGTYNFKNVVWEEHRGYPDDAHFSGHSAVETPVQVEVQVKTTTGPVQRTIVDQNADALRILVRIPALSRYDEQNGSMLAESLSYAIDVRTNSGAWVEAVRNDLINQKTTSAFQIAHRVNLPFQGSPWDVRVRRITPDSDKETVQNDLWWEGYVILVEGKFIYPNTAAIACEVNAEDMGSSIPARAFHVRGLMINVPTNYDPKGRTYSGIWDGTFKIAWTNNPAWIFYDLIVNDRYGLGEFVNIHTIDKWSLYTIAQYCDQLVPSGYKNGDTHEEIWEPRFTFNGALNTRDEAYFVLQQICTAWRGMAYWSAGQIFGTADMPADPMKLVSPANVIEGEISYSSTAMKARHSVVIVSWNDPNDFYRPAKEVVINQEMLNRFGWREKNLQLTGCTSRGLAHRYGKWILDTEQHETETIEYSASWDHADVRPGDIIAVADPHKAQVRFGGRIVSHKGLEVVLDEDFDANEGETYDLMLTMPKGSVEKRRVYKFLDGRTVQLEEAFADEAIPNAMFAITGTDITPRNYRVISLEETEQNVFKITALFHDPHKFARIERDIIFDPLPYDRPSTVVPPPTNISVTETGYTHNGNSYFSLLVSWTPPQDVLTRGFVVAVDTPEGDSFILGTVAGVSITMNNISGGRYKFYVQTISFAGLLSEAAECEYDAVGPEGFAPPIVTDLELRDNPASNEFSGRDLAVSWKNKFANSIDIDSESGTPTHVISPYYSHNIVRVYHGTTGELLRTRRVSGEEYVYDYSSNSNDSITIGKRNASRSIRIEVEVYDVYGRKSAPISREFINPVPAAIAPSYLVNGPTIFLSYTPVTDPDYAGTLVWRAEEPGIINPLVDIPYYEGTNNPLTIPGHANTGYYFRIAAYDSFGKSDLNYSSEFTITTLSDGSDSEPPAIPTGLQVDSRLVDGRARVFVTWDENTEEDLAGYDLEIKQASGAFVNFPVNTCNYEFDAISGITYQIRLRARDWHANSSGYTNTLTHMAIKDSIPPGVPTEVQLKSGLTSLWLSWKNPSDDDLAHVEILESEEYSFSSAQVVATITGSSFARTGLEHEEERFYWLRAVDTSGNKSDPTEAVNATTSRFPKTSQLTIDGLLLTPNAPSANRVRWAPFTVTYGAPGDVPETREIEGGNALWKEDSLFLYYVEGETKLSFSDSIVSIYAKSGHLVAIYRGDTDIQLADGKTMIDGNNILTGAIGAEHLIANEAIITGTAQLADAIITDAKIAELSAEKLKAGSAIAGGVLVGSNELGDIADWASDPAARVNGGSTMILPGFVQISGETTLADWRSGSDSTKISGGAFEANSIKANIATIGLRGITVDGITFEHNSPGPNSVSWTAGTIEYTNNAGHSASVNIAASATQWTAGTLYLYWVQDSEELSFTTSFAVANDTNNVILATYRGGVFLFAAYGRTIIDGGQLKTQSVDTDQLKAGAVTANVISVTSLSSLSSNLGAIMGGSININDRFTVDAAGNVMIRSGRSGARLEIGNQLLQVFDGNGTLRVRLGIW